MNDERWFLEQVLRGSRQVSRSIHVVLRDGTTQSVDAIAVVVVSNECGLVIQAIDNHQNPNAATAMLCSIDKQSSGRAHIVIEPGAANVALVSSIVPKPPTSR